MARENKTSEEKLDVPLSHAMHSHRPCAPTNMAEQGSATARKSISTLSVKPCHILVGMHQVSRASLAVRSDRILLYFLACLHRSTFFDERKITIGGRSLAACRSMIYAAVKRELFAGSHLSCKACHSWQHTPRARYPSESDRHLSCLSLRARCVAGSTSTNTCLLRHNKTLVTFKLKR